MSRTKQRAGGRKNRPSVDSGEAAVPPTPERARHAEHGIEAAEPERTERGGGRAFVDSAGRPSRPWRVVDTLAVLERVGTLTADQRAAGERFRALFEIGGRDGASAVRLEPRTAAGDPIGAIERRVAAGRALAEAARLLGAPGALYSVTVDICGLGMGLTARDELLRQRRGGSSRMLAEALDILANEWRT
jgi:hypothetical protein